MGSQEAPLSQPSASRHRRRPLSDEASSPKRQKRSFHRHHHSHRHGDMGDRGEAEDDAIQMLRMRRAPFYALVKRFMERGLLTDSIHTSVEEQVTMFLQVLYAIGELRGEMIKPTSMNTPTKIKNSYRWFSYFRDCIGAIDGTHVSAKVPRSMSAAFRGRKHYTSQNVLAAEDFDMRFTYVLAGWEGSAHDASILADSLSRPDGLQIPDGWGEDEFFEEVASFDEVEIGHGVEAGDNDAWKVKRQEWADVMWEARGNTTI
ncbi:hypothetical protein QYE76_062455 [Lolium multiflorum]|uniref:DDE Tnp4 domain-containing protein n=1 Tax=Lolium multiflorum TaxID=4521 RepID=A0AAD8S3S5_LOLMU|nr:hypothetical protein QYE76_062455 [Lolium multiflorum]